MALTILKGRTPNIVNDVNKKFTVVKRSRQVYERDWQLNLAFVNGRQWVTYDRSYNRVVDWTPPNKKPRMKTNLILPVVRIEYSRLTSNKPFFVVRAGSVEPDDVAKSKGSKEFLYYLWERNDYENAFQQALLWALVCGTGFVKTYYDPDAGDVIKSPDGKVRALGDVLVDYCSPFELFIDPYARDLDEASWVIHARVRPVEYIEMKYGVSVPAESTETVQVFRYDILGSNRVENNLPSAVVKEYWERPNARNPEGKYAVVVGNKLLYEGINPYYANICPIPFAMMKHLLVPGRFYGDSVVTHLRQINVLYNKLKSDIVENSTKLSNPPLVAPINALMKTPEFEPGEVIYYNPLIGGDIDQLKITPYPPQLINTLMRLTQEIDNISGITEVSRGMVPRGARSAEAMAYLLEREELRYSVTAAEYERMIGKAMTNVLRLARAFYDVPRLIRVLGENNSWEVKQFKAEDIPADADVRVESGSTLPKSKSRLKEELYALWDRKILRDPRLLLRLADYGNLQEIFGDLELDTSQALRENDKMVKGNAVEVEDFHNHLIHIVEHNKFRKTVEYEKLNPKVKELFARHVSKHENFIQQQQQKGGELGEGSEQGLQV